MPVSHKDFDELLYDLLPEMYRKADAEALPIPLPLKRFLQVASVGFEQVETEVDDLALLFNVDLMKDKFIDPVGRMLGFDFPVGTTQDEKRRIISNLPTLYKLKGNDRVFETLARLVFHKDAKTEVKWIREESRTNVQISLEIGDSQSTDIEGKRGRFLELIEYFRPVNVGTAWTMLVFYEYFVELKDSKDNYTFDTILMDDNYNPLGSNFGKQVSFLNNTFNYLSDNFTLYGGNTIPETMSLLKFVEESFDRVVIGEAYEVQLGIKESGHLDTINSTEIENVEVFSTDQVSQDVIVDYRQMLNYGLLGSTMVLNAMPKVTNL